MQRTQEKACCRKKCFSGKNRYTFLEVLKADIPEHSEPKYKYPTVLTVALTPLMFIKLYALYDSLIDTVGDTSGLVVDEKLAQVMRWVLPVSMTLLFALGNQIIINIKYTPFMIKGLERAINAVKRYFSRSNYDELIDEDQGSDQSHYNKWVLAFDYSTWIAFSFLHGAFTFTTMRELIGDTWYATLFEVLAGLGLAMTLAPMRYCHGIQTGQEYHEYEHRLEHQDHEHSHEDVVMSETDSLLEDTHHAKYTCKSRCSLFKISAGIVLNLVGTAVFAFESLHVIRLISGDPLTHHIPSLFETAFEHPYVSSAFLVLSVLGGIIETLTEVDHIDFKLDHTPVIAPKSLGGKILYRCIAIMGALLSDHIEPFVLFYALGVALNLDTAGLLGMGALGTVLTLFDSITTGPMHAYLFGVLGYLFQNMLVGAKVEEVADIENQLDSPDSKFKCC